MAKIYYYKLTADDGGAPCVERGILSLAICKPMIRGSADKDDIIIGFAADKLANDNHLIYIARVTDKLTDGNYYRLRKFARRSDCIYAWRGGRFIVRPGAKYHGTHAQLRHDLGSPRQYPKANVLLSNGFVYWGARGPSGYKSTCPAIVKALHALTQGHRVNHGSRLLDELERLITKYGPMKRPRVLGRPATGPSCDNTHDDRCAAIRRKRGREVEA